MHFRLDLTGIIPACAGSTAICRFSPVAFWDHPRMCGEHSNCVSVMVIRQGSSPHVRGALRLGPPYYHSSGIIPACAGSTVRALTKPTAAWDHPRMCGEHPCKTPYVVVFPGSSPHVRGAQTVSAALSVPVGIIPACAGSTCVNPIRLRFQRDHPRMCGEHVCHAKLLTLVVGSSPHVRGAHAVVR